MPPRPLPDFRKLHATPPVPWKNGTGVTRELSCGDGWRISVAEVTASGPFSVFAGRWRHSVVIGADGLDLRVDGRHLPLDPLRCVGYDGALAWRATLRGGPTRVFNVMTELARARAQVVLDPADAAATQGGDCVVLCLASTAGRLGDDGSAFDLAPGDHFLLKPGAGTVHFAPAPGRPAILLAAITPRAVLPASTNRP